MRLVLSVLQRADDATVPVAVKHDREPDRVDLLGAGVRADGWGVRAGVQGGERRRIHRTPGCQRRREDGRAYPRRTTAANVGTSVKPRSRHAPDRISLHSYVSDTSTVNSSPASGSATGCTTAT